MEKYKQSQIDNPYNEEPVYYCKDCLSLKIRSAEDQDFCDKCGSANIGIASIFEWQQMYDEKYNN